MVGAEELRDPMWSTSRRLSLGTMATTPAVNVKRRTAVKLAAFAFTTRL